MGTQLDVGSQQYEVLRNVQRREFETHIWIVNCKLQSSCVRLCCCRRIAALLRCARIVSNSIKPVTVCRACIHNIRTTRRKNVALEVHRSMDDIARKTEEIRTGVRGPEKKKEGCTALQMVVTAHVRTRKKYDSNCTVERKAHLKRLDKSLCTAVYFFFS